MQADAESRRWPAGKAIVAVALIATIVGGFFVVRGILEYTRHPPNFPSLADSPDTSLHGTIAYFDGFDTGCVRVIAAAGKPAKDALCVPSDVDVGVDNGIGPELTWLEDGRLQMTVFKWTGTPDDINQISGTWSKIIDVSTGDTNDVPAEQIPQRPTPAATGPEPAPNGDTVKCSSNGGRIEITLNGSAGTRTLLSAKGNPDYRLAGPCIWSPDRQWILAHEADEGRLLLVTATEDPKTRVLAERPGCIGSCNSTGIDLRLTAVTKADALGAQP